MPVTPTYPGVYIQEIPNGGRSIVGVATSITAFVGRTRKGPTNDPILCNSFADFEQNFGGLHADYPLSYAVWDFYTHGGRQALIVRLVGPNYSRHAVTQNGLDIAAATMVSNAVAAAADLNDARVKAQAASDTCTDKSTGEKDTAQKVVEAVQAAVDIKDAKSKAQAAIPHPLEVAKKAFIVLPVDAAIHPAIAAAIAVADVVEAAPDFNPANKAIPMPPAGLFLEARNPGVWGNSLRARIDYDGVELVGDSLKPLTKDDLFNLTVRDMDTGAGEHFINLTCKDVNSPRHITNILKHHSNLVQVKGHAPAARPLDSDFGLSDDKKKIPPFSPREDHRSVGVAAAHEGSDGVPLTRDDYTTRDGLKAEKKGLYALSQADLFNILCLPPDKRDQSLDKAIFSDALAYCVERRAMLIVDAPLEWTSANAITSHHNQSLTDLGLNGTAACNAALYFPRLVKSDPKRAHQPDTFAACGSVAGIWASTDLARGVWKAPAGLDAGIANVQKLSVNLNDLENGTLNLLGINCLRTFPVSGTVVYGARTMRGADPLADEYRYVPVRRMALFIEESLSRGLQWVVFEPNDEPLWVQIRLIVGAFLHDLFRKGAFQGARPQDAYFVRCDRTTTTQNDINLGIVNILVGFAPLNPAEFVIIKLQQMAGQIGV